MSADSRPAVPEPAQPVARARRPAPWLGLLGWLLCLALCAPALAAETAGTGKKEGPLLSEATWKTLNAVRELMDASKWQEAQQRLLELAPRVENDPYEAAVTAQTLGYVYTSTEQYPKAIEAFTRALERKALPADVAHTLEYNLAQLLLHQERYKEGLARLESWLKAEKSPSLEARMLAAQGYYRAERYAAAVPHIREIIARQKDPEDTWFRMLLACHQQAGDYAAMAEVLEQLVRRRPEDREHWLQLAAAWQKLGQDRKALATLELANRRGLLDAEQTLRLARLYVYLDMPHPGAQLLEQQLESGALQADTENLRLLAEAWLRARERERAVAVFERLASLEGSGETWLRVGQIYCDLERWSQAIAPLERALAAGGLQRPALARLLLGVASAETGATDKARDALTGALQDASTRAQAEWWLERLNEAQSDALPGERG